MADRPDIYLFLNTSLMLTTTTDQLRKTQIKAYTGMVSGTSIIHDENRKLLLTTLAATIDGTPMAYERLERGNRL
jgi:uncharacterized protein YbjQ (UPF0145 family)